MNASLLRTSFHLIEPNKDAFAEAFYRRLLEKYPEMRQFFAQVDMSHQARKLAATLEVVVAGIEKGENITPALQNLGERHKSSGVRPEHYPMVGKVLIETFHETLGSEWTPAYQEAWVQAYEMIAQTMAA